MPDRHTPPEEWEAADHITDMKHQLHRDDSKCPEPVICKTLLRWGIWQVRHTDTVERQTNGGNVRKMEIGPVKINGYQANDIVRLAAVAILLYGLLVLHGCIPGPTKKLANILATQVQQVNGGKIK